MTIEDQSQSEILTPTLARIANNDRKMDISSPSLGLVVANELNKADSQEKPTDTNAMTQTQNLLKELPFYISNSDPLTELSIEELISQDHRVNKNNVSDGFIGFHHLTLVSSSANNLSKFFQLTMGFKEVARKGLENNSRLISSHVLRNGDIFLEISNTLEPSQFTTNPSLLPAPLNDLVDDKLKYQDLKQYLYGFSNQFMKEMLQRNLLNDTNVHESIMMDILKVIDKTYDEFYSKCQTTIEDKIDCFLYQEYLKTHGEGVVDISFQVKSVDDCFSKSIQSGANVLKYPKIISDQFGSIKIATVTLPNTDIRHTLIENIDYKGNYLPNYESVNKAVNYYPVNLITIDHCVENYSWNQMMEQAQFYARIFGFRKFWSVDENDVSTDQSSLRSIVMTSSNGRIKMPINEPSPGKYKSQIEEFYDYNGGPGVQHIALRTGNIIEAVTNMVKNGIEFNKAPPNYYLSLRERFKSDDVKIHEDLNVLEPLNILIDYDASTRNPKSKLCNYILQIFTKPLNDRPTLFIEIIQRYHHNGFGKGTFKGLFESIEEQQRLRGNLVLSKRY